MRIRGMRARDRPAVISVYNARASVSAGLMRRNPAYWRREFPRKGKRDLWLVAEDRGQVVGYAAGLRDPGGWYLESHWRPEADRTALPERLLRELLDRVNRRNPIAVIAWVTDGSPARPLYSELVGHRRGPWSLFMAGVVDPRALLRDAARVVRRRTRARLRLRAGGHALVTPGPGAPAATVLFLPNVLLGVLLGIRSLNAEIRRGTVTVRPGTREANRVAREAFPPRRFFIQDAW